MAIMKIIIDQDYWLLSYQYALLIWKLGQLRVKVGVKGQTMRSYLMLYLIPPQINVITLSWRHQYRDVSISSSFTYG